MSVSVLWIMRSMRCRSPSGATLLMMQFCLLLYDCWNHELDVEKFFLLNFDLKIDFLKDFKFYLIKKSVNCPLKIFFCAVDSPLDISKSFCYPYEFHYSVAYRFKYFLLSKQLFEVIHHFSNLKMIKTQQKNEVYC